MLDYFRHHGCFTRYSGTGRKHNPRIVIQTPEVNLVIRYNIHSVCHIALLNQSLDIINERIAVIYQKYIHITCKDRENLPTRYCGELVSLPFVLRFWQMETREAVERMNFYAAKSRKFVFAFDFEKHEALFLSDDMDNKQLLFEIKGRGNAPCSSSYAECLRAKADLEIKNCDQKHYYEAFAKVQGGLQRGDSFLCNLTTKTKIQLNLSLEELFHCCNAPYKLCVPNRFVCFSPESFIRTKNNMIYTFPMKGTINADLPDAERLLISDEKELREHFTIVDLMRNDLNMVSRNVSVEKFRYVERIDTIGGGILQTSSLISGHLPCDWQHNVGNMVFSLLPAGSISGAPKSETVNLIQQAEKEPRGFYTGVFGYFDGRDLDTAVLIRYIEKQNDDYYFRSGGGITTNSLCNKEYEEVIQKVYLPIKR